MADIQNETEDKVQDANDTVDVQEPEGVGKSDTSQEGKFESEFNSNQEDNQNENNDRSQEVDFVIRFKHKSNIVDLPLEYPSVQDLLGMKKYQEVLIGYIKNAETPITIALQGKWGSGKTSLMTAIKHGLCECPDAPFHVVWINTWQYSLLSTPQQAVISILQSILDQITKLYPKNDHVFEIQKIMGDLIVPIAEAGYFALDKLALDGKLTHIGMDSKKFGFWFKKIYNACFKEKSNPSNSNYNSHDQTSVVVKLKNEIKDLIRDIVLISNHCKCCDGVDCDFKEKADNMICYGAKQGFIFFIDDLDRIDPVLAVEILDIIKNVFDFKNCVFVLAVDYDVVVKGLEPKLGKPDAKNEHEYRRYFDKLIQLPITIPEQSYRVELFLKNSLKDISFFDEVDLERDNKFVMALENVTLRTVGSNPRTLKRLINTLSLIDKLSYLQHSKSLINNSNVDGDKEHVKPVVIVNRMLFNALNGITDRNDGEITTPLYLAYILICIQIAYPLIYRLLLERPNFKAWDEHFANRFNAPKDEGVGDCLGAVATSFVSIMKTSGGPRYYSKTSINNRWEFSLYRICLLDEFLEGKFDNIYNVLNIIADVFGNASEMSSKLEMLLPALLITNVSSSLIKT